MSSRNPAPAAMAKERSGSIAREEDTNRDGRAAAVEDNEEPRAKKLKSKRRRSDCGDDSDGDSPSSESRSESEDDEKKRKGRSDRRGSRKRKDSESDQHASSYSDESESESESESERRRRKRERRRRKERDEERERRRRKEKRKRRREEEERKKRKKNKKMKEKEKKKKEKNLGKTGAVTNSWGKYGILRETDMWNKRPEFQAWLLEVKQVNLETLPNWEEKQMFKEFMEDHNTATFPSKKYYDLEAYHRRQIEKDMIRGLKKAPAMERTVFDDEEQRRQELLRERERQKGEQIEALKRSMQSGMAQDMKEQARLREEMAYQYKLGNFEAAAAIQKRLDPDAAL